MRARRYFGLTPEQHDELTKKCAICGFNVVVELHHKDKDKTNNDVTNFIPLCPNHHRMAHMNLLTI